MLLIAHQNGEDYFEDDGHFYVDNEGYLRLNDSETSKQIAIFAPGHWRSVQVGQFSDVSFDEEA